MKKTLIALMALAGVLSANAYDVWTLDSATASDNGTVTTNNVEITLDGFTQTPTQAVSYTDGSFEYVTMSDFDFKAGSEAPNSYTLMTFVNFSSLDGELFIFGTGSDHNGGVALSYIGGQLAFTQKRIDHYKSGITLNTNTWYHIAVAYDNTDNTATFFVNGEEKASVTLGDSYAGPTGSNVYFGAASTNGSQDNFAGSIAQFQIVKGVALDAAGVLSVANPPIVPEPATATLSLLALAGLAARRRRK